MNQHNTLPRAEWQGVVTRWGITYTCGYCDSYVSSNVGFFSVGEVHQQPDRHPCEIRLCPGCKHPTAFFWEMEGDEPDWQVPTGQSSDDLDELQEYVPEEVVGLYGEALRSMEADAPTAAVLACRKILMHVAVDKGANEGTTFIAYVKHLAEQGWLPPDGQRWVDHIREKSNEANHKIVIMDEDEAERLCKFVGMLLRFVYVMPKLVPE